jgi:phospholipid transport system substrate-binding protein
MTPDVLGRIERYGGEPSVYLGDAVEEDQATARTKLITRQDREVPIDYRMRRTGGRWRVYDVRVEGLSLVRDYRPQLDEVVRTSSSEELVQRLRAGPGEP